MDQEQSINDEKTTSEIRTHEEQTKKDKLISKMLGEKMRHEKLSSRKVAAKTGVAHTTIVRILDGHNVSVATLQKIANFLETDPGGLVFDAGETTSEDVSRNIAIILGQDDELERILAKAVEKVKAELISPATLKECVRFVAWRIGESE